MAKSGRDFMKPDRFSFHRQGVQEGFCFRARLVSPFTYVESGFSRTVTVRLKADTTYVL